MLDSLPALENMEAFTIQHFNILSGELIQEITRKKTWYWLQLHLSRTLSSSTVWKLLVLGAAMAAPWGLEACC